MMNKTLEELTRDQHREGLRVWNQPAGGSKEQLKQHLTRSLEKEILDPAEVVEVEDARPTVDPLMQILEELSLTEHHLTNLAAKSNQQEKHLAAQPQQFAELRQAHHEQITELRQAHHEQITELRQ